MRDSLAHQVPHVAALPPVPALEDVAPPQPQVVPWLLALAVALLRGDARGPGVAGAGLGDGADTETAEGLGVALDQPVGLLQLLQKLNSPRIALDMSFQLIQLLLNFIKLRLVTFLHCFQNFE